MCDNPLLALPVVKAKGGANNMQVHPLMPVPFILDTFSCCGNSRLFGLIRVRNSTRRAI